jgi:FkbM family methyltransferase
MKEIEKWFRDLGDKTHRVNYSLSKDSTVIDVGAHQGKFIDSIYQKYESNIYSFEPVKSFANDLKNRWSETKKVKIYDFALGIVNDNIDICLAGDASSIHIFNNQNTEKIKIRKIDEVLNELMIETVDLIKINIEGEEYPLLDYCLDINLTSKFKNIQVQFHDFIENAEKKRNTIRDRLSKTHYLTYDYEFVWENWKLND